LFAIPINSSEVITHSFHSLFLEILLRRPVILGKKVELNKLIQSAKMRQIPVVVFPEGCPTNGRFVIEFVGMDFSKLKVHVFGFSHGIEGVSPDFVSGNGLCHLFDMTGRMFASMKIRIATRTDLLKYQNDYRTLLSLLLRIPLFPRPHFE
jgi:hypothetical protein